MKRSALNKSGQIWVETVMYTLIAFVIIGLVLSFVKPKIEEIQDKAIIEQSIELIEDINTIFLSLSQGGSGNKRLIELGIKKGTLKIDGIGDQIVFEIESRYTYSEPGKNVYYGNILIQTEKIGNLNTITLTTDRSEEYNITYQGGDKLKSISKGPTPYKIFISNMGQDKFDGGSCATEVCEEKEGFEVQCIEAEGVCRYTSKRTTIDIEII